MKLTSENVHNIFLDCLYKDGENTDNHVKALSIKMTIGFNPDRLNPNTNNIISMLSELPNEFMKSGGGGWSFLNMCSDKNDNLWSGHEQVDELLALGLAIKKINYLMPREMWDAFPGGMPYLIIDL